MAGGLGSIRPICPLGLMAVISFLLSLDVIKRMLREARLCLLGRTGLSRFVAAERFLVRYYEIVFPEFQIFGNLLARAHYQKGKLLP
jgi:hypothetical protein